MTETVTMHLRNVPVEVRELIKRGAGVRGITAPEYVSRTVKLHQAMLLTRTGANSGSANFYEGILREHGLAPVREGE